ncbi:MAG: hypothetical protein JW772_04385, partial [Candidatus Diapherotrites archaeon]|nr:hypothetical protein [Candidatus Diapherotrites archaeon]
DIALLLDAVKGGQRILEVDLGELIHKARTTGEKAEMSQQVLETMLKKAGLTASKYKAFVFSEKVLFDDLGKPRKNAADVIAQLKKRRFKVLLLGYGKEKELEQKASLLNCDSFVEGKAYKKMDLLHAVKKAVKKQGAKINETVTVAGFGKEVILLKASGLGIGFGNDEGVKATANKNIEELSELLLID